MLVTGPRGVVETGGITGIIFTILLAIYMISSRIQSKNEDED